jgi:hypothetical protein
MEVPSTKDTLHFPSCEVAIKAGYKKRYCLACQKNSGNFWPESYFGDSGNGCFYTRKNEEKQWMNLQKPSKKIQTHKELDESAS